jgi:hypothetical protein
VILKSLAELKLILKLFFIKLKRKRWKEKIEYRKNLQDSKFVKYLDIKAPPIFLRGLCPNLGSRTYRQHNALIPSVVISPGKVEIPVFTMLVHGSNASIHSLR